MNGSFGFQMTPIGIIRGDQAAPPADAGAPAPAMIPQVAAPMAPVEVAYAAPTQRQLLLPGNAPPPSPALIDAPITGKQIVKQCKERMRVLEKALRAVPQMQEELESLRRLVEAAQRPAARVVKIAERNAGSNR